VLSDSIAAAAVMDADADENAVVDAGDACMLISVTRGHAGMLCWLGLLYFPLSAPTE
jgi:hypothetical protein